MYLLLWKRYRSGYQSLLNLSVSIVERSHKLFLTFSLLKAEKKSELSNPTGQFIVIYYGLFIPLALLIMWQRHTQEL